MAGLEEATNALEGLRKICLVPVSKDNRRWIIYKITSKYSDKIYIGSDHRDVMSVLKMHINRAERYKRLKCFYLASYEILKLGGVGIDEIEVYDCNSKIELLEREEEYIMENLDMCVNIVSPLDNKVIIGKNKRKIEKDIARRKMELEKFIESGVVIKLEEGYDLDSARKLAKEEDMRILDYIDSNIDVIYGEWMAR